MNEGGLVEVGVVPCSASEHRADTFCSPKRVCPLSSGNFDLRCVIVA